jgi:hypothetical protein
MSKASQILRFLPDNAYQAATLANAPSASNVYATMLDIPVVPPSINGIEIKNATGTVIEPASHTLKFTGNVSLSTAGGANAEVTVNVTGGGGSGEVNTASNVGSSASAMTGLYYQKLNEDLQFYSLISSDGRIDIDLVTPDNVIDLSLDLKGTLDDDLDLDGHDIKGTGGIDIIGDIKNTGETVNTGNTTVTGQVQAGTSKVTGLAGTSTKPIVADNNGLLAETDDIVVVGQVVGGTDLTNVFATNACQINCNNGMAQVVDGDALTGTGALTFTNQKEGATYAIIFIQGSGTHNVTLPSSSYWVSASAFDFSTLANDERALITATYLDSVWTLAVKELTLI